MCLPGRQAACGGEEAGNIPAIGAVAVYAVPDGQRRTIATVIFAVLGWLVVARRFRVVVVLLSVPGIGSHIARILCCRSPGGGSPLADLDLHGVRARCSMPSR